MIKEIKADFFLVPKCPEDTDDLLGMGITEDNQQYSTNALEYYITSNLKVKVKGKWSGRRR